MHTAYKIILSAILLSTAACSTLNDSIQLGAGLGALSGAAATYSARRSVDENPSFETVATGAAIGMGVGLLTSYLVHKNVHDDSSSSSGQTDMYFGDLPPSPFIFPKNQKKQGANND